MALFDQLKEKLFAGVDFAAGKLRHGREIVKISNEKRVISGEIRRRYEELGKTIYESKGEAMAECRAICDRIDELKDREESLTARDVVLRSRSRCPRCGEAMPRKAKFCSACGSAMPEAPVNEANPTEE